MGQKTVPFLQNVMTIIAALCALLTGWILYSKKADFLYIAVGMGVMFLFTTAVSKILFGVLQTELGRQQADETLALLKKRQLERDKEKKGDNVNAEG